MKTQTSHFIAVILRAVAFYAASTLTPIYSAPMGRNSSAQGNALGCSYALATTLRAGTGARLVSLQGGLGEAAVAHCPSLTAGIPATSTQSGSGVPPLSPSNPPQGPPADVIIGNPPFLGAKRLKPEHGADYVNALRKLDLDVATARSIPSIYGPDSSPLFASSDCITM